MFLLAVIEDKLKTLPDQFERDSDAVLLDQIDIKFANKVLVDVGLCITIFDFLEIGDPYIYPAEGSAHQHVRFRMVVFRPFAGEVLVGRISSSYKDGLWVSLEFFDEVFIPSHLLQQPSEWREESSSWVWNYAEDVAEGSEFIMAIGEQVRFKVRTIDFNRVTTNNRGTQVTTTSETYNSSSSSSSSSSAAAAAGSSLRRRGNSYVGDSEPSLQRQRSSSNIGIAPDDTMLPSVMKVIGACNEEGLGLVSWWLDS